MRWPCSSPSRAGKEKCRNRGPGVTRVSICPQIKIFRGDVHNEERQGHVDATFVALAVSGPHHQSGELRGLLVDRKVASMPEIPTLREMSYPRDLPSPCAGIFGPAGMSEEAKKVLIPAIEKAIKSPDLISKMERIQYLTDYKPPDEHRKLWIEDYENARSMAKKMNLAK